MESFGDIERRVKAERAKALEIDTQRAINAELLYKRQQRLKKAIVYICNILISRDTPHFNCELQPQITRRVPVTSLFGKVKKYENEVIQPPYIVRGWAINEPYIHYAERGPDIYYDYNMITENGEYYNNVTTYTPNGSKPQTDVISSYKFHNPNLSNTQDELKKLIWADTGIAPLYNEIEEKLVNFAIDQQIDLSELDK